MHPNIKALLEKVHAATPPLQAVAQPAPPSFEQLAAIAADISRLDAAGYQVVGLELGETPLFTVRTACNRRRRDRSDIQVLEL